MSFVPLDRDTLPDDVDALKDLVVDLHTRFESLLQQVAAMRRAMFGPRSERLDEQADLFAETTEFVLPPEVRERVSYERRASGRPALPKDLPRTRIEYELDEAERAQFACVRRIGEEICETLEYTAARLTVIEHARGKYRCEDAAGVATIRTAGADASPLAKSNAGASLLAQVLVAKYADHVPLNRQERIFARHGVRIARQTLCDWTLASTELLARLMVPLREHVLAAPVIFTDDTTLPLIESGRGKTVTARLWAYLAGGQRRTDCGAWKPVAPAAYYEFTHSRAGEHPQRLLGNWRGFLQADDYAGYAKLFRGGGITHATCWMHARRRFFEIDKTHKTPGLAREALRFIGELYRIEQAIRDKPPDERRLVRQTETAPMLADFRSWLEAHHVRLLPEGPLAKAMAYTLSNWGALTVFLDEGMLEVDNGAAERAMRPVAVSRKNWMFAGSERGGDAAAVAFSLVETARLNGVEPYAYLCDVLARINRHRVDRLAELLPFNWKAAR